MSLEIRNISKSFRQSGQTIPVLSGLSLNVPTGQCVAVLGPSGSGKSTFLSLVAGLDRPDQGEILIDGKSLDKLDEKNLTQFRAENIGKPSDGL
ncbi:MAG: ATP-binding cassette domain-containing protein [Bdellovibrionota bacterium]